MNAHPTILIADDEALARDRLRALLADLGRGDQVVGEAASGPEVLERAQALQPDVLLLDIRMPGMDGLEVARHLLDLDPAPSVIFTTAYDEYALQAFDAHAIDYLVKPIRPERLALALDKAAVMRKVQREALQSALREAQPVRRSICVRHRGELRAQPVADILCFRAEQKYVVLHTEDEEFLIDESLRSLEEEFADTFVRIHRNALVARERLRAIEKGVDGQVLAVVEGLSRPLEVSRRHAGGLRRLLRSDSH